MQESKRGCWSLGLLGALLLAVACGGYDENCTEDGVCLPDPSGERGRDGGTDGGDDDRDGGRDGGDDDDRDGGRDGGDDDCDGGDDDCDDDDDDDDDGSNRGPG